MSKKAEEEEEEEEKLRMFLEWGTQQHISESSLKSQNSVSCLGYSLLVSHFPQAGGRGLGAARNLRKGELILKVPKEALMTSESLMLKDEMLFKLIKHHPYLSSTQIFSVALLNEVNKGKSSWWYPYLKQMPRSYEILASFSQLEIQALQIDDAIWAAEKAVTKAKSDWKQAGLIMQELDLKSHLCTFKAWLWASGTISSRTMHISWDDAGCLCPVGDFFNYAAPGEEPCGSESMGACHSSFSVCSSNFGDENSLQLSEELHNTDAHRLIDAGFEEHEAAYCFYARQNYQKGDQVLLSYGTYTNLELLEHYGFLLNENPNDKAFIVLEPDMYALCSFPRDSLYICQDGRPSFALLSTLRLWATAPKQRRTSSHLACSGNLVSTDNEIIVMKWLAKTCQGLLDTLPTSVEQDELLGRLIKSAGDFPGSIEDQSSFSTKLLASLETNGIMDMIVGKRIKSISRFQLAVQWRVNYKRILVDCISHCAVIIDGLSYNQLKVKPDYGCSVLANGMLYDECYDQTELALLLSWLKQPTERKTSSNQGFSFPCHVINLQRHGKGRRILQNDPGRVANERIVSALQVVLQHFCKLDVDIR